MAISSTARMLTNAPINIVHPYIFNVNIHFTVSHCSAGDSTTGIPFGHHSAALLGMTYFFCNANNPTNRNLKKASIKLLLSATAG